MTLDHLLPSWRTGLEVGLSPVVGPRLLDDELGIAGFKFADPNDAIVKALVWEYGLEEVLPYLDDPRRAIREGILWQRTRGTAAALETALSWRSLVAVTVEEEEPGSRFARFQIDPGRVLDTDDDIIALIALTRMSAPARSRLSRVFHGYDLRRLILDRTRLGRGLLSDVSGVPGPDGVRLSFGRSHGAVVAVDFVFVDGGPTTGHAAKATHGGGFVLDLSRLSGAPPTSVPVAARGRLISGANAVPVPVQAAIPRPRVLCKGEIVLSAGPRLGSINARLPSAAWVETGKRLVLSGGRMSRTYRLDREPINVFVERVSAAVAAYDGPPADQPAARRRVVVIAAAVDRPPAAPITRTERGHAATASRPAAGWPAARWPARSWGAASVVAVAAHSTSS